ncbi:MAG: glycosyltransferase family 4 protein [Thermoplasmatota archaeon]|nr:glycosyltransferase family 4 protein [Candidatus Thermoplasmatota archaeon]MBU1913718.1 glycosyltransferase family 4 protein [Candidatus Thermoplasmatota archaeon]
MATSKVLLLSMDDPAKGGGVGGKHTHIRLLAKGLEGLGVRTQIVSARATFGFKLLHLWPGAVRRRLMKSHDKRYIHYSMQFAEQLRRNLRKNAGKADLVNPHDAMAEMVLREDGRFKETPVVLTLHGYYAREAASDGEISEGSPEYRMILEIEKEAYVHATRIICVDSRIKDYVLSNPDIRTTKVVAIPNAVDVDEFVPPTEEKRRACRSSLGIPGESLVLLCPRRLVPKNGVLYAVLSMRPLLEKNPNALLIVAGNGPERSNLETTAKEGGVKDHVRFVGSIPHRDVYQYYAAADVIVIPSILSAGVEEATSLSMLEGMACAKPVIVTSVGGLKETVRDGITGLVVEPANPEAIAEAAIRLAADPGLRMKLGSAARAHAVENNSYVAHAQSVLAEYEKAVPPPG